MNLNRLLEILSPMAEKLHPLTLTNASNVVVDSFGEVVFEYSDAETFKAETDELKVELADANGEIRELTDQKGALERELRDAQGLLDETRSDETPGDTLRSYIARAEQAEDAARRWKIAHNDMERELTALRKRKGITVNYVKYQKAVLSLIGELARYPNGAAPYVADAKKLVSQIYSSD